MSLLVEDVQDVLGILGAVRVQPLAVEKLQRVEPGERLARSVLAGDGAQSILGRLPAVLACDEYRKIGVLGRLVLKMC